MSMTSKTIAINGIKLDEIQMLKVPYGARPLSSLRYPSSRFFCAQSENTLSLLIPAFLALELYRTGILPQDARVPVSVKIGRKSAKNYLITDVRYPNSVTLPDGIHFTLTGVPEIRANKRPAHKASPARMVEHEMYVTDIRHYLDEQGEMAPMPTAARNLACFLTLLIEAATSASPEVDHDSRIRCRAAGCHGTIRTNMIPKFDEISWRCSSCGQQGVIRNWHETKWDQATSKR